MKKTTALLAALLLASTGMAAVQSHAAETGKEGQVITRVGTRPSGVGSHTTFTDRKSTRLNSSHPTTSRMPSSA